MLTIAKDTILEKINSNAEIQLFGQEINPVTYAVAKSDMLIK
jgi:type I restriction enzyme M protein